MEVLVCYWLVFRCVDMVVLASVQEQLRVGNPVWKMLQMLINFNWVNLRFHVGVSKNRVPPNHQF